MAESDNRYDKDGNVYEKKDGGYEPKWDIWSQRQAKENVEREVNPDGFLPDGTPVYRTQGNSSGNSNSSSGGAELGGLVIAALLIALISFMIPFIQKAFEVVVKPFLRDLENYAKELPEKWRQEPEANRRKWKALLLFALSAFLITIGSSRPYFFLVIGILIGLLGVRELLVGNFDEKLKRSEAVIAIPQTSIRSSIPVQPDKVIENSVAIEHHPARSLEAIERPVPGSDEEKLLKALLEGLSDEEIADLFHMSTSLTGMMMLDFYKEYNAKNREELVEVANRLLPTD